MISRRLLRVKVIKALYGYVKSQNDSIANAEKELFYSINKTYDLYHYLFYFLSELRDYAQTRIEIGKQKLMPTEKERNPNTKFIDNKVNHFIAENIILEKYYSQHTVQYTEAKNIIKKMFGNIIQHDYYKNYMNSPKRSFEEDKRLVIDILTNEFEDFDDLYNLLEEQSIFWNDEIEFVVGMIIKTVKSMKEKQGNEFKLLPLFKNEEDREFAKCLFRHAIIHYDKYSVVIDEFTPNWDVERIAFMDTLIMVTALSEAVEFSNIPIKVTIDEYIELAKFYSTSNSSTFVNGVLDKVIQDFTNKKIIVKQGLGLL
ncbi:MAG: transcription antitermination factor NusB [Prevotellaceae bacterium]|jgi:N utilization substance protein B|nr:transcription antitermination factor NusB [Prevotellaceae bacterium]